MKRYVEQVIRYYQDISETKFGVVRTTAPNQSYAQSFAQSSLKK